MYHATIGERIIALIAVIGCIILMLMAWGLGSIFAKYDYAIPMVISYAAFMLIAIVEIASIYNFLMVWFPKIMEKLRKSIGF